MEIWMIFLLAGALLIAIEIAILQMALGWVMAWGVGSLLAGIIGYFIPGVPLSGLLLMTTACFVGVIFILRLYRPPAQTDHQKFDPLLPVDPTYIGQTAIVIEKISLETPGKIQWSGAQWTACIQGDKQAMPDSIKKGCSVRIIGARGNHLVVEPD